jgi:WD40 repeat protein
VEAANAFVFVISPDSVASPECAKEIELALAANKRIVPLLHRPVDHRQVRDDLAEINWLPFEGEADWDASYAKLVDALGTDLEWRDEHRRLYNRAREWDDAKRSDDAFLLRGSDLEAAEEWLASQAGHAEVPTDLHREFIRASRRAATRRQRITLGGVTTALVVSVALAVVALVLRSQAIDRQHGAQSRELAIASGGRLGDDPELALILALHADDAKSTAASRAALRRALDASHVRATMAGGRRASYGVAFAAGGRLVSWGPGGAALWDARTGRRIASVGGRDPGSVELSRNGTRVVVGGRKASVADTATGRMVTTIEPPAGRKLEAVAFAGDRVVTSDAIGYSEHPVTRVREAGRVVGVPGSVAASDEAGDTLLVTRSSGAAVLDGKGHTRSLVRGVRSGGDAALSADGSRAVVADGPIVTTFSTRPPHRVRRLTSDQSEGQPVAGASFALSRDGRLVATAVASGIVEGPGGDVLRGDKSIHVWDAGTGKLVRQLRGHAAVVGALAFSGDGRFLASGSDDASVRVWDLATGAAVAVLRGHTGPVSAVAFDEHATRVASASADGTARVWAVRSTPAVRAIDGELVAIGPDGRYAAVARRGRVSVYSLDPVRRTSALPRRFAHVDAMLVSPRGEAVAVVTSDGESAELWRARRPRRVAKLRTMPLAFSDDGRTLVCRDETVAVETGTPIAAWKDGFAVATAGAITADGRRVVTAYGEINYGGGMYRPRVWDASTGAALHVLRADTGTYAVDVSPDGRLAALAGAGGEAALWDLEKGKRKRVLARAPAPMLDVRFSRDGRLVAAGGQDRLARIWETRPGGAAVVLAGHDDAVVHVGFDRSGRLLATTGGDDRLRVWDTATGDLLVTLPSGALGGFAGDRGRLYATVRRGDDVRLEIVDCAACGSVDGVAATARSHVTRALMPEERGRYGVG